MRTAGRDTEVRRAVVALVAAVAAGAPAAIPDVASTAGQPRVPLVQPDEFTGRDFAGVRFDIAPQRGALEFRAATSDAWVESSPTGPVRRLLLRGDVFVRLGTYLFSAQGAVVWLHRLPGSDPTAPAQYQVFVYFEKVGTPSADAAVAFTAESLSVRGVIIPESGIKLVSDLPTRQGRSDDPLVVAGEDALARLLRPPPEPPARSERPSAAPRPGSAEAAITLAPPGGAAEADAQTAAQIQDLLSTLPSESASAPIFAEGVISIAVGQASLVSGGDENAGVITGGVTVEYDDLRAGKSLQITAERAVVFLSPGKLEFIGRLRREDIRGIYLEGDVVAIANGGHYTLRGPRVYYDLTTQKAVVLDAVFWTYDQQRRLPLYLRADVIRQEAERQFTAESATIATTAFFEPQFSLGATSLTITGVPRAPSGGAEPGQAVAGGGGGGTGYFVDANNITLRAGTLPFFYFPVYSGYPDQIPLRDLRFESSSQSGGAVKSTWNLLGLLGIEKPGGASADLLLDGYFDRGIGGGARVGWGDPEYRGGLFAYGLPDDHGTDLLLPGTKIDRDGEARGILLGEHMQRLDEHWSFLLEGSLISDEDFVTAFMEDLGANRREFTTRGYLRRLDENTALTAEIKGTANDFISNESYLQTPGAYVQKLPELAYIRQADDLFEGVAPGLVSYYSEYRYSLMNFVFDTPLASDRGYNTNSLAQRAFGINANQSISDRLYAQGLRESNINRFDTRHEFAMPLLAGPVNITPFTVGRLTAYDNNFEAYSPDQTDKTRLWGAVGASASTTIQSIDDSFDSRLFNMHRVRHIIQPYATAMLAGTNIDRQDLPVYDRGIEDIAEGSMASLGIRQVVQTQRGGPGRWRSVDVFTLNSGFSFFSNDEDPSSTIGRWVDYRPELSNPGNFMTNEGRWQLSSTFSIVGSSVFDFDLGQQSRSNLGAIVEHMPGFVTSVEVRNVHADSNTYLDLGARYEMTSKYTIAGNINFNLNEGGVQNLSAEIRRRLPGVIFGLSVSYNETTDETSLGLVFQPEGFNGQGARFSGVGSSGSNAQYSGVGGS